MPALNPEPEPEPKPNPARASTTPSNAATRAALRPALAKPKRSLGRTVPVGAVDPYIPSALRPVRGKAARPLEPDAHFAPHQHAWAQLAYCASGLIQVTVQSKPAASAGGTGPAREGREGRETTYIVPPSRAVWVAPGVLHTIAVIEAAELRTLYLHASATPAGWDSSRMVMVSPLLRELVGALGSAPAPAREAHLAALLVDELGQCGTQNLGVPMPNAQYGDKRLLNLCEAVLRAPGERANLAQWVADVGASERTIARLFREQLGMPYQQWHQQAILAHALPMLARGLPVAQVAAATGYASGGAFSAMFKSAMGQAPSHFQSQRFLHATP